MGQGNSAEDAMCGCLGDRLDVGTIKDPLTLNEAFEVAHVLSLINDEIDNLYKLYDTDKDDNIEWGKQITAMILSLKEMGFEFGKRKHPDTIVPIRSILSLEASNSASASNDGLVQETSEREKFAARERSMSSLSLRKNFALRYQKSEYSPIPAKRVKCALFVELGEDFADDGLTGDEFKQWMQEQIFQKKTNLLVLFRHSKWCDAVLEASFDQADKDKNGRISQEELGKFMEAVCEAIEIPVPEKQELMVLEELAVHDPDKTGLGLHHDEFKTVLINLLAVLYHQSFLEDMDSWHCSPEELADRYEKKDGYIEKLNPRR